VTEAEEQIYIAGQRQAILAIMKQCARDLGVKDPLSELAYLLDERERTRARLREVCALLESNDWPDNADLANVVEKYVLRQVEDAVT
jgi:hypothetical protein